jgi:putative flippase GtrA
MCTIGLLISLTCLWVSHYVLGFTSVLADNVAANVVGLAAGTAFRFWAYKRFVFTHQAEPGLA